MRISRIKTFRRLLTSQEIFNSLSFLFHEISPISNNTYYKLMFCFAFLYILNHISHPESPRCTRPVFLKPFLLYFQFRNLAGGTANQHNLLPQITTSDTLERLRICRENHGRMRLQRAGSRDTLACSEAGNDEKTSMTQLQSTTTGVESRHLPRNF